MKARKKRSLNQWLNIQINASINWGGTRPQQWGSSSVSSMWLAVTEVLLEKSPVNPQVCICRSFSSKNSQGSNLSSPLQDEGVLTTAMPNACLFTTVFIYIFSQDVKCQCLCLLAILYPVWIPFYTDIRNICEAHKKKVFGSETHFFIFLVDLLQEYFMKYKIFYFYS